MKLTMDQIKENLSLVSDNVLLEAFYQAVDDCNKASIEQRESEWHEACFVGVMILAFEVQARGLSGQSIH